ncbi:MAG: toll/interleukin-1 receptor domain-containing protein [Anaerolineae bacterium]|nr:toll/interleukin-1 receptor domain-containing protein [Anaerolineae bacterium]
MPDLFVSHATADDAHTDRFADALAAHGITTWIDHRGGIKPGAPNWDRAIREAIKECDAGVLLMTPRSLASDICAGECLIVREQGKPPMSRTWKRAARSGWRSRRSSTSTCEPISSAAWRC